MTPLYDRKHLTQPAAIRAARADGWEVYATSAGDDGAAVTHLQRPAKTETPAAFVPPVSTGPSLSEIASALGSKATAALASGGFEGAAILTASRETLAAVPGVGPATLDTIDSLRS